jgi:basic membrane protein A
VHVADIKSGEIGIAPFHNFDATVPQGVKDELKQISADIASGAIKVDNFSSLGSTAPAATPAATAAATAAAGSFKGNVCEVTDVGGVNDKSFNSLAWIGAQAAATNENTTAAFLESKQQTDYDKNINEYLTGGKCGLIITVGFLMGDATKAAGLANPNQKFQILDNAYDMTTTAKLTNVWAQLYSTEQGAFMAGYVAAAMSKTHKVGTFGGINIPPVADFEVGFQEGILYYNKQHTATVQLLGWDNTKKDGLFTGDFSDQDKGKTFAQNLLDEGADVIMPVAGSVGLGAFAAIKAAGNAMAIGVDQDQFVSAPEYDSILLTSVQKHLELSVQSAAKAVGDGSFKGGVHVADIKSGEIGIAPFHNFDSQVPQGIKDELKQISADIASGKLKVDNFSSLP